MQAMSPECSCIPAEVRHIAASIQRDAWCSISQEARTASGFGGRRATLADRTSSGLLATHGLDLLEMEERVAQNIA
jgi:hypothetical protein